MTTITSPNKKIPVSRLLNIILIIILFGLVLFGWWYFTKKSPLDTITTALPAPQIPEPKYLYTIYGDSTLALNKPANTKVYNNKIYVADPKNGRIAVFSYDGKFLNAIGKTGTGKLRVPMDFAIVGDEIFVTDGLSQKIHIFNLNGEFKRYFAEKSVKSPGAIFYRDQKFYVFDYMTLKILDDSGKQIKSFGREGDKEGEFYFPYSVYVSDDGQVYVADSNNKRIQVFDGEGKVLKVITGADINNSGSFSVPRGTAFDKAGNLYTAEGLGNGVAIVNKDGKVFGRFSYAEPTKDDTGVQDEMKLPTSVFIDENQRLYVTEYGRSRVLVYSIR